MAQQGMPHVAVVIVGYRSPDEIGACLAALGNSDYPGFDVVIVENGGPAAFAAMVAKMPARLSNGRPVRLVDAAGNLGFAGGVNLGIDHSLHADAWWILNPDTEPAPGALSALVRRLTAGDCDAVGGVLHYPDGTIQSIGGQWQGWLGRAVSIGYGTALDTPVDARAVEAKLDYLMGASMLISNDFLRQVGPMREDYFLYAEEIEWFLRGKSRLMRLGFAADARVVHHQGTTTGAGNSLRERSKLATYLDERNRLLLTRDLFAARLPVVVVSELVFMLARFGRRRAWRQIGYGVQGWWAGLIGERGAPRWSRR